ncbi:MAG: hypothetical protein IK115_04670 [Lachnospiraceae bacterium]|nr:hypothetical protein [Lachnospiraceae bacterium]
MIRRRILAFGAAAALLLAGFPSYAFASEEDVVSENAALSENEAVSENETVSEDVLPPEKEELPEEELPKEELPKEEELSGEEAEELTEGAGEAAVSEEETAEAEQEKATAGESGESAAFEGICIDGDFKDWRGVPKSEGTGSIQLAAVVQDENYVYVYLRDDGNCCAAWAGPHNNGKFSFVSDLGYTSLFQLHNNPARISGVDGASVSYRFSWGDAYGEWEIAVPVDHLPINGGSYSFGFYQGDRFVNDAVDERNRRQQPDPDPDPGRIVYDGLYGDWTDYPHELIHYATDGTQERVVDGEGALFVDGSTLYGHCITTMAIQVEQGGNDVLEGVVLRINESTDWKDLFEFRFATVDAAGNIDWHPQLEYLPLGTYEYIITDVNGWGNAKNLDELKAQGVDKDGYYGRITVTVAPTTTECEWWLDLSLLAARMGVDETDIKTIEVKYEQIGDRWLKTAGASSGAAAGIALGAAIALGAVISRKKSGDQEE